MVGILVLPEICLEQMADGIILSDNTDARNAMLVKAVQNMWKN